MRRYPEKADAKVMVAHNGREAVDQVLNKDFDLIQIDI